MFIVWAAGQEPGPPDKGRAVIYSGRSAELGVVGESGGGGRAGERGPFAGQTTVLPGAPGPAAAAAACLRRDPRRGQRQASLLLALVLSFRPPHPHPPRPKRKEEGGRERPPLRLEGVCAPPAAAARACGGGGVCGPVFGQLSTPGEKNICLKVQKKGGGVGWGGGKELKNSKAQTGTHVAK